MGKFNNAVCSCACLTVFFLFLLGLKKNAHDALGFDLCWEE